MANRLEVLLRALDIEGCESLPLGVELFGLEREIVELLAL